MTAAPPIKGITVKVSPCGCTAAAPAPSAYKADLSALLAPVQLPLREVTLGDVQRYQDKLASFAITSR